VCTYVYQNGKDNLMPKVRGNGEGGLYYLKSRKLYRGVIDDGFKPDGSRRQRYVHDRTKAGARAKLDALKAELKEYGAPLDKTTTVAAWASVWLETVCRPNLKPNSYAANASTIRTWIVPTIGTRKVASLKPSDIRTVHTAVRDAGRSSTTARHAHQVLHSMLKVARVEGLCARNVADDVTPPKTAESPRGALSPEDAIAVLKASAETGEGLRWWLALLGGIRQGERCGALIESLDLDNPSGPVYKVEWSLTQVTRQHGCGTLEDGSWACGKSRGAFCPRGRYKLPDGAKYRHLNMRLFLLTPKSGHTRYVPLVPQLADALRRYLEASKDVPNPYGLIWRHPNGEPITAKEDEQMWRDLLYKAGVITKEQTKEPKDRAPGTADIPTTHWARHTTATVLMELGVDAKIIGEIVGHASEQTTRRYQHVSSPVAREAMGRLGEHWSKALEG
jgi:integrase